MSCSVSKSCPQQSWEKSSSSSPAMVQAWETRSKKGKAFWTPEQNVGCITSTVVESLYQNIEMIMINGSLLEHSSLVYSFPGVIPDSLAAQYLQNWAQIRDPPSNLILKPNHFRLLYLVKTALHIHSFAQNSQNWLFSQIHRLRIVVYGRVPPESHSDHLKYPSFKVSAQGHDPHIRSTPLQRSIQLTNITHTILLKQIKVGWGYFFQAPSQYQQNKFLNRLQTRSRAQQVFESQGCSLLLSKRVHMGDKLSPNSQGGSRIILTLHLLTEVESVDVFVFLDVVSDLGQVYVLLLFSLVADHCIGARGFHEENPMWPGNIINLINEQFTQSSQISHCIDEQSTPKMFPLVQLVQNPQCFEISCRIVQYCILSHPNTSLSDNFPIFDNCQRYAAWIGPVSTHIQIKHADIFPNLFPFICILCEIEHVLAQSRFASILRTHQQCSLIGPHKGCDIQFQPWHLALLNLESALGTAAHNQCMLIMIIISQHFHYFLIDPAIEMHCDG